MRIGCLLKYSCQSDAGFMPERECGGCNVFDCPRCLHSEYSELSTRRTDVRTRSRVDMRSRTRNRNRVNGVGVGSRTRVERYMVNKDRKIESDQRLRIMRRLPLASATLHVSPAMRRCEGARTSRRNRLGTNEEPIGRDVVPLRAGARRSPYANLAFSSAVERSGCPPFAIPGTGTFPGGGGTTPVWPRSRKPTGEPRSVQAPNGPTLDHEIE